MKAEKGFWMNPEIVPKVVPVAQPQTKFRLDVYVSLIALLAAFLNAFQIWTDHYVNTYYTMTVGSMLQSFHNFFFASLDSAGSVTVDKPPLTFWIQAASAYVFGLHGWSVILPQALAGVGSVILLNEMVKPTFGKTAGRIAALAMATNPVAAAVARTNNIDAMLVFTLLLASWILFKAAKKGSIWSLIGAFSLIGLAFNMKMLQAYMVLPAFYLYYILAAEINWRKKASFLVTATGVLLIVSMSWALIVDSIPADKRPFIGSSTTNSVMELAFGYNGVSRLTGNQGPGKGGGGAPGAMTPPSRMNGMPGNGTTGNTGTAAASSAANGTNTNDGTPADDTQGQPPGFTENDGQRNGRGFNRTGPDGGDGGAFNTGTIGPFRLFQSELSGQASWLLPFVGITLIGLFAGFRRRNFTQKHKEALFWLTWLVPVIGFFSIAGFFHQYYLIMLAPPAAALVGAGWSELWKQYREQSGWTAWLLPAGVLATAAFAWYIMHPYDDVIGSGWSMGIAAGGLLFTLLMVFANRISFSLSCVAAVGALILMFVGPIYWAATPITYGQNSMLPQAGPNGGSDRDGMGMERQMAGQGVPGQESTSLNEKALAYLKEHNTGETYLFAATDYGAAAPYIIDAGEKVISLGGFSGSDQVYTVAELEALVSSGKLKYFMVSGHGMGGRGGSSDLTSWIEEHGSIVPTEEWKGTPQSSEADNGSFGGRGGDVTLYEVKL